MCARAVRPSFLMSRSARITIGDDMGIYDRNRELRVTVHAEAPTPTVIHHAATRTESKTFQEPTDDDPDPDAEACY